MFDGQQIDADLVGRPQSFLREDLQNFDTELRQIIGGARILFIGAAGSIGLNTLKTVASYKPKTIHVIDHNENGLAEVVRTLRSGQAPFDVEEFVLLPFDYGGKPFELWLAAQGASYDYILNFAALKHVRSEKDPYSILAMLETNVAKLQRLSEQFANDAAVKRVFCVSTDKAANPSSMMGATKRLMEHALFGSDRKWADSTQITSARFANVAMSNGSLLQSWRFRLEQGQPMACPDGCRRYFVSLEEAGHLCTLGALLGEADSILVPKLNPEEHLVLLQSVAEAFLTAQGLSPYFTTDEEAARRDVQSLRAKGQWPVLMTPLDTAGEKPYEEFVGANEEVLPTQFAQLDRVPYVAPPDTSSFGQFLGFLDTLLSGADTTPLTLDRIKDQICTVEHAFRDSHVASTKSLDARV